MKDQDSDQVGQITLISKLLRNLGANPDDAAELTELISDMASANVVSRLKSTNVSQNTKYNTLIWLISAGVVILSTDINSV